MSEKKSGRESGDRSERQLHESRKGVEIIEVKDPKGDPSKVGTLPAPEADASRGDGEAKSKE
jgi:hypothetical protein